MKRHRSRYHHRSSIPKEHFSITDRGPNHHASRIHMVLHVSKTGDRKTTLSPKVDRPQRGNLRLPTAFMLSSLFHLRIPWFTSTQLRIIAQPSFRSPSSSKTTSDPQTNRTCSRFLKVHRDSLQPDCYPFVKDYSDNLRSDPQAPQEVLWYKGAHAALPFSSKYPSFTSTRLLPSQHVSSRHVPNDYSDNLRSDPQAQLRVL